MHSSRTGDETPRTSTWMPSCVKPLPISLALSTITALGSTLIFLHAIQVINLPGLPVMDVMFPAIATIVSWALTASLVAILASRYFSAKPRKPLTPRPKSMQLPFTQQAIDYDQKLPRFVNQIRLNLKGISRQLQAEFMQLIDHIANSQEFMPKDFEGVNFKTLKIDAENAPFFRQVLDFLNYTSAELDSFTLQALPACKEEKLADYNEILYQVMLIRGILYHRKLSVPDEDCAFDVRSVTIKRFFFATKEEIEQCLSNPDMPCIKLLKAWANLQTLDSLKLEYFSDSLYNIPTIFHWDSKRINELGVEKLNLLRPFFKENPTLLELIDETTFQDPGFQKDGYEYDVNYFFTRNPDRMACIDLKTFTNPCLRYFQLERLNLLSKEQVQDEDFDLPQIPMDLLHQMHPIPDETKRADFLKSQKQMGRYHIRHAPYLFNNLNPSHLALLSDEQFKEIARAKLLLSKDQFQGLVTTLTSFRCIQRQKTILKILGVEHMNQLLANTMIDTQLVHMPADFFACEEIVIPEERVVMLIKAYLAPYPSGSPRQAKEKSLADAQTKLRQFKLALHIKLLVDRLEGDYLVPFSIEQFKQIEGYTFSAKKFNGFQQTLEKTDSAHLSAQLLALGINSMNHLLRLKGVMNPLKWMPTEFYDSKDLELPSLEKTNKIISAYVDPYPSEGENRVQVYQNARVRMLKFHLKKHLEGIYQTEADNVILFSAEHCETLAGSQLSGEKFNKMCAALKAVQDETHMTVMLRAFGLKTVNHLLHDEYVEDLLSYIPPEFCGHPDIQLPEGSQLLRHFESTFSKGDYPFPKNYDDIYEEDVVIYQAVKEKIRLFTQPRDIQLLIRDLPGSYFAAFSLEQFKVVGTLSCMTEAKFLEMLKILKLYQDPALPDILGALGLSYVNTLQKTGKICIPLDSLPDAILIDENLQFDFRDAAMKTSKMKILFDFTCVYPDRFMESKYQKGTRVMNKLHLTMLDKHAGSVPDVALALCDPKRLETLKIPDNRKNTIKALRANIAAARLKWTKSY